MADDPAFKWNLPVYFLAPWIDTVRAIAKKYPLKHHSPILRGLMAPTSGGKEDQKPLGVFRQRR
ncbi:MAG: hypothetical protein HQL73_10455 [Magnetococcales bacterium]|nr:hypothetical protein [Magnetococcales bacterium]